MEAEILSSYIPYAKMRSMLNASVERVSYFNQENGQCILDVQNQDGSRILISGKVPWVYPGMLATCDLPPAMKESNILQTQNLKLSLPTTERGLKKFLRSEALSGIGPKLIKILSKSLAKDFFLVLENSPQELLKISGIGEKKKNHLLQSWQEFQSKTQLQAYLFKENLPLAWFQPLWLLYGTKSLELLTSFPYKVGSELHLPFGILDNYALNKGLSVDSLDRLRFGVSHVLWSYYKQGHCAYPEDKVIKESMSLLETSREQIEEILEVEIVEGKMISQKVRDVECLYFKEVWLEEIKVAKMLKSLSNKEPPWGWFNLQKVLSWSQEILNIQLAPLQIEAIKTALSSRVTVITGGPGTGKTTLIRSLVTILQTQFLQFALCSPTGRAAQRLSEAANRPAQTLHRLLKYDSLTGKFFYNKSNPLPLDLVLIDEASMVDLTLMSHLLEAMSERCALILVGDVDQLPSVGAGNVFYSILSSPLFPVVRLTEIYRQSAHSHIKENAQRINLGQMPLLLEGSDFQYLPVDNSTEAKMIVQDLIQRVIPESCNIQKVEEIQILVPLNQGVLGTQQLNEEIKRLRFLQEKTPVSSTAEFGNDFRSGDKVMVLKNDYKKEVFNGDIGFIDKIDFSEQYVEVNFSDRPVKFDFSELDQLTLAYAISIHKSQGSEYPAVIVVITQDHYPLVQRHLLYTAVTRGKNFVFLVAEPSALQKALLEVEIRWENLTTLLQQTE